MRRRQFLTNVGLSLGAHSFGLILPASADPANEIDTSVRSVGVRCSFGKGWSDPSLRWMVTRLAHTMPVAASDIQLVYANVARGDKEFEAAGFNPIVISAAVEFPEGVLRLVTFSSRPEIVVAGGDTVISDAVRIVIPAGAIWFTRTIVRADAPPYLWPITHTSSPQCGDRVNKGANPTSLSDRLADIPELPAKAFGPLNILGKIETPAVAVAILGDSVVSGEPGVGDRFGDRGYVERALAANVAWCNLAVPGDSPHSFIRFNRTRLGILRKHFTHAICALGIDEIRAGNEAAARAHFLELWQLLSGLGLKVFQTTITTHTASADHWTTAEGQWIVNPNFLPGGIYHRINNWIRSTPAPLSGYFDPAKLTETGLDSGVWLTPEYRAITNDGPHPNALGAEIAARAIDLSELRL